MECDGATTILDDLASGRPLEATVAVVFAHPDDETLSLGGQLRRFAGLTLVQLTDGAPREGTDAARAGYGTREAYAAAREREARCALARLRAMSHRRIRYDLPDQEAVLHADAIAAALERDLRDADVVFTHPYEGGHPDHDAAALAVRVACERLRRAGRAAPVQIEFTSYHCRGGEMITGRFWPQAGYREVSLRLAPEVEARKREALACFATQSAVLSRFDPAVERFRPAPPYDFSRPPPPGVALYDLFGWSMTSGAWRTHARAAVAAIMEQA